MKTQDIADTSRTGWMKEDGSASTKIIHEQVEEVPKARTLEDFSDFSGLNEWWPWDHDKFDEEKKIDKVDITLEAPAGSLEQWKEIRTHQVR